MSCSAFGRVVSALRAAPVAAMLAAAPVSAAELPTIELAINGHRLVAEVAATVPTRTTGLMNRFSLQPDHGMLFVFNEPQPLAFWMKNTYVPLSIAFIASDGRIINIEDMAPRTENTHPARGLAIYALEMRKGWFAERGIRAGDAVKGLERAPRATE
ncbi:MAG TPA: DUF192 domain-containing protein [Casimicrobiaceae bacterium]|nr:DUF192 domain-containing protein [Casimicrobiaceae bacterium]